MRLSHRGAFYAVIGVAACLGLQALGQSARISPVPNSTMQYLQTGFQKPPEAARLRCYWWWLNGNTDEATITHDLEEMKAKGFGGALLVDANGANQMGNKNVPAGPMFGSPAWVKLFTHALREADRLGLEITLNITSGWNLGGPDVTPAQASKLLTYARVDVRGGKMLSEQLPTPEVRNGFYRQIAVLAYPLQRGAALALQPGAGAGATAAARSEQILRARSAAVETGFSMPDSSAMLEDGVNGKGREFAADSSYADTRLQDVHDISRYVTEDGTLHWAAPTGEWEVLRIGYTDSDARVSTSSGAWQGLAIDYLSRDAFEEYWGHTVQPLLEAAKPYHSLKYLATDSWELGGTNWTQKFREEFIQLRGYDPVPWLPVVAGRIVGDRSQSTRFLTDLRRTVADLVVSQHYDVFAENAHENGMGVQAESGGPHGAPLDALETFRNAAMPQTEFWSQNAHRSSDEERFFVKEAASAANIYGQHLVADEGETSIGPQWSESLATDLKPTFDMAVTEGMNRLVWHEFTSSPASTGLPGQEYFAGTHLNPKVTWWNAGGAFFTYLNRVQFLMQQGTPVDDVLYYYGDNIPDFVRLKADDPARALPGYDYDVTDEDALLRTIRTDGPDLLGPSGVRWRLLAMPRTRRVSVNVLEHVRRYVRNGGTVMGMPPVSTSGNVGPAEQAHFHELVNDIWQGCTQGSSHVFGSGRVFCTDSAHAVLQAMHVLPDFAVAKGSDISVSASSTASLDYAHRRVNGTDIYFVRNGSGLPVTARVVFRMTGKKAELWDPVTAEITIAPEQQLTQDHRTELLLSLPPFGSTFVIFTPYKGAVPYVMSSQQTVQPLQFVKTWTVQFQLDRGAPVGRIAVSKLQSWTQFSQPGIRYFSGTGTYRATVLEPKHAATDRVLLQLGDVHEIARVWVNGEDAGSVWARPDAISVGRLLHSGKNTVAIAVTNLWPNRIIGDLQPGVKHRYTSTNITKYTADSPLLPSGLVGPVEWVIQR